MPENGARIQIQRDPPRPEPLELDILYEDDWLLAVNKPAGLVVHPTYKNTSGTLLNGVLWHLRDKADIQPGLVSRLDKDTSGLVLVALAAGVHARVQRSASAGLVRKDYLAVVQGRPEPTSGTIQMPLARDPSDRRRVVVADSGARCETRYEVLHPLTGNLDPAGDGAMQTLVRCDLPTGRTHQIRVHLAARGWPILGDPVYGERAPSIARQALHSWRVSLTHPVTGLSLQIEAPIPTDMRRLVEGYSLA